MTCITINAGIAAEKLLMDANFIGELLLTMRTQSENDLLVRNSLWILETLVCFVPPREHFVAGGGIPFAVDIIQKEGQDALLLKIVCGVVERLFRRTVYELDDVFILQWYEIVPKVAPFSQP